MSFPMNSEDTTQSSTARRLCTIHEEDVRIIDGKSYPGAENEAGEVLLGKWPSSVAGTALGLNTSELQILRQQQQLAFERSCSSSVSTRSSPSWSSVSSRWSQPRSHAASAASSQGEQGRVFLDPGSVQQLNINIGQLMGRITQRHDVLQDAVQASAEAAHSRAEDAVAHADAEIARMRRILAEIDGIEEDFERLRKVRDVLRSLRGRIDKTESRLSRTLSGSQLSLRRGLGMGNLTASLLLHHPLERLSQRQIGGRGLVIVGQGSLFESMQRSGSITHPLVTQCAKGPLNTFKYATSQNGLECLSGDGNRVDQDTLTSTASGSSDILISAPPRACVSDREYHSLPTLQRVHDALIYAFQAHQSHPRDHARPDWPKQPTTKTLLEILPTKNLAFAWWIDHECRPGELFAEDPPHHQPWEKLSYYNKSAGSLGNLLPTKTTLDDWDVNFREVFQESSRLRAADWRIDLEVDDTGSIADAVLSKILGEIENHLCTIRGGAQPRHATNGDRSPSFASGDPPSSQVQNERGKGAHASKRSRSSFGLPEDDDGDEGKGEGGGRGNAPKRSKPTADVYAQYLVCTEHAAGEEAENPSCVFSAWPTVDRLKQDHLYKVHGIPKASMKIDRGGTEIEKWWKLFHKLHPTFADLNSDYLVPGPCWQDRIYHAKVDYDQLVAIATEKAERIQQKNEQRLQAEIQRVVHLTSQRQKQEIKKEVEIMLQQRYTTKSRKEIQATNRIAESKSISEDIFCDSFAEEALHLPSFDLPGVNDTALPALNFQDLSGEPIGYAQNEPTALECTNSSILNTADSQQEIEPDFLSETFLGLSLPQNLWEFFDDDSNHQMTTSCIGSSNIFRDSSISGCTKSSSITSQESESFVVKICRCKIHSIECNIAVESGDESCLCCSGWFSWSKSADPFFSRAS